MFRYGPLHAVGDLDPVDGRRYAVTIFRQSDEGVLMIAGKLRRQSIDKPGSEILRSDYHEGQRISFAYWRDAWSYFLGPPFAPILEELREKVAGFDLLSEPPALDARNLPTARE